MEREEPKTGIAYLRVRFRKRFRCLPARCLVRNPPRSQRLECAVERMRARRPRIEALQPTQRRFSCGLQFITMLHGMDWKLSQIAINAHLAHYRTRGAAAPCDTFIIIHHAQFYSGFEFWLFPAASGRRGRAGGGDRSEEHTSE